MYSDKDSKQRLVELQETGLFSDFTITCKGHVFKMHKIVLYTQSEYFRTMLTSSFKEAETNTVDFSDDDLDCLKCVIDWFYQAKLPCPQRDDPSRSDDFIVRVYALADKYDVPALCLHIASALDSDPRTSTYYRDYVNVLSTAVELVRETDADFWCLFLSSARHILLALTIQDEFKRILVEHPWVNVLLLDCLGHDWQSERHVAGLENRGRTVTANAAGRWHMIRSIS